MTILLAGSARRSAAQAVVPESLALNDSTTTASFTARNITPGRTEDLWFGPACDAPLDNPAHGDPFSNAWQNQSTCVAPWLTDYPQHVTLAPGEQRQLSVRIVPPATLPDGEYTARLIWARSDFDVDQGDTSWAVGHYEIDITYTKGPAQPRRARTRWHATPTATAISAVRHTPAVVVLDDRTPTNSFTLTNPGATPTDVWLAVDCPWFRVNYSNYPISHQYEAGWHGRIASAALWLSGYPQHLVLAPHERRTIVITAFPNIKTTDHQPDGSYYARITYVQSPVLSVTPGGDTTFTTPSGTIPIVYHKGATAPRLVVSHLRYSENVPGAAVASQACVTVEQPGLGAVAVLHAEVDDAEGHPVRARASATTVTWSLDTTVALWNVPHHDPMDISVDGQSEQSPDPVCFDLPHVASGQYQLVVSAFALEDTAKSHPVRATLAEYVP